MRASAWFPTIRTSSTLFTYQSDRTIDLRIKSAQVCSNTLLLYVVSCVALLALPSSHAYFFVLLTVNRQHFSKQRLHLFSVEAQLTLETTRGYCWRLVFLGLESSYQLQAQYYWKNMNRDKQFYLIKRKLQIWGVIKYIWGNNSRRLKEFDETISFFFLCAKMQKNQGIWS